jgi:hypothetical protein
VSAAGKETNSVKLGEISFGGSKTKEVVYSSSSLPSQHIFIMLTGFVSAPTN